MSFQNSSLTIPGPSPVIPVHDTGIQVAHKQTSIESGYNGFDEIAERLDPVSATRMTPFFFLDPSVWALG
ncbi:hypothetical protein [Wolbachia endosymbiont (group B) of Limnophora tigrina]|uniref:hypothetical protein n=1 Tax=Wolbachia endosymbiont (group B) of Limnophora tigrina TaxID=3139317 RepID=UPI0035B55B3F